MQLVEMEAVSSPHEMIISTRLHDVPSPTTVFCYHSYFPKHCVFSLFLFYVLVLL